MAHAAALHLAERESPSEFGKPSGELVAPAGAFWLAFSHAEPLVLDAGPLVLGSGAAYLGSTLGAQVPEFLTRKTTEPIFNVPPAVIATVAILVGIHLFRLFALTEAQDRQLLLTFAFIPARYGLEGTGGVPFPGGFGADLWTFFSYAFLHADLLHIGLNLAWLIPFGTALARRFGAWRYGLFMLVTAAAGALAQLVSDPGTMEPVIGASAAISGAMAAALRFIFQGHGPVETWRDGVGNGEAYQVPAMTLLATFRDARFLLFLAVWMGLNALFGLGAVSFGSQPGQSIAWQAHIGGFLAGLFLFSAFDPVPRGQLDTEPSP